MSFDFNTIADSAAVIADQAKREAIESVKGLKLNALDARAVDYAATRLAALELARFDPAFHLESDQIEQDQRAAIAMLKSVRAIKTVEFQDRITRIVQSLATNALRVVLAQITAGGSEALLAVVNAAPAATTPPVRFDPPAGPFANSEATDIDFDDAQIEPQQPEGFTEPPKLRPSEQRVTRMPGT
ncbi:MAG: hypothetical protein AAGD32_05255 [Planctomycetota bacterium]